MMHRETYWLIVDTVRVKDAEIRVRKTFDIKNSIPLFKGCQFEHLLPQSPLVIEIGAQERVLATWQSLSLLNINSVMFKVSETVHQHEWLSHLQKLLIVTADGHKMLFRYYTNSIWLDMKQREETLVSQDIATLLGPASSLFWLDNAQQQHAIRQTLLPDYVKTSSAHYTFISPYFQQWI